MDNQAYTKRSWVEIDLTQLEKNYLIYQNLSLNSTIMAVVKANAYGHGDIVVAKTLEKLGVTLFAVSNIDEAIAIRKSGIKGEILILGYTPLDMLEQLYEYELTQTLLSEEYAKEISNATKLPIKFQFAIDTGMNRIGLDANDVEVCATIIRKYAKRLNIVGIFTHLCVADSDVLDDILFNKTQIQKFEEIRNRVSDLNLLYVHCLNSAAGIYSKQEPNVNNIIRLGIILYGLKPNYKWKSLEGIKPILTWKTVVSRIKQVRRGESIGYGRTFIATKDMMVATLPTGYADGYNRALSNKGYVLIDGKCTPIVGRICMDQMMVDVTNIANLKLGDEVVLLGESGGKSFYADDMAHLLNTIGYEIVCNISKRVARVYNYTK